MALLHRHRTARRCSCRCSQDGAAERETYALAKNISRLTISRTSDGREFLLDHFQRGRRLSRHHHQLDDGGAADQAINGA
jgi:hypothetical protein